MMTMEISVKEKLKSRGADGDGAVKTEIKCLYYILIIKVQPKSVSGF